MEIDYRVHNLLIWTNIWLHLSSKWKILPRILHIQSIFQAPPMKTSERNWKVDLDQELYTREIRVVLPSKIKILL